MKAVPPAGAGADDDAAIERLLADPAHAGNPLRAPLARLHEQLREQVRQLDRITRISDRYQNAARRENLSLGERLAKQMRQIEKIARISDRYQAMLHDLNQRLERESTHDALTGLPNRRLGAQRLQALAGTPPPVVGLADIDHFKAINDGWGHDAGDQALLLVAQALAAGLQPSAGWVARWGGEEFLLLWQGPDLAEAGAATEALRQHIAGLDLPHAEHHLHLTLSFGLAAQRPGETLSATLRRADDALYLAKQEGRNRVRVAA